MVYFALEKDVAVHQHAINVLQLLEVGAFGISEISFKAQIGHQTDLLKLLFTLDLEQPIALPDVYATWHSLHLNSISHIMHLVMIQLHHIIFKHSLYVHLGVHILPILAAQMLTYLVKLVLFNPFLTCSFVVSLRVHPIEASLSLSLHWSIFEGELCHSIGVAILDWFVVSSFAHVHEF